MKIAVIYYSLSGNTRFISTKIADILKADIFEIKETKRSVTKKGFLKYFCGGKQVVLKESPNIEDINIDLNNYDTIFIGTPVWVRTFTPAVKTFLSKYKIKDKKIYLFCSHNGAKGKTISNMKKTLMGNEVISEFEITKPLENKDKTIAKIEEWVEKIK